MSYRKDPILWLIALAIGAAVLASGMSRGVGFEVVFRSLCLVLGMAAGSLFWRHRKDLTVRERQALGLVSFGIAAWAIGIGVHLVDLRLGRVSTSYLPADTFFVAAAVVGIVGVARLPTGRADPEARKILWLDQAIAALSSGGVFWHLVLTPNLHDWSERTPIRLALTLLYPMIEFVLLQMAVDLVVRGPATRELGKSYRFAAAGIISLLAGNVLMELDYWRVQGLDRQLLHLTNFCFALAMLLAGRAMGRTWNTKSNSVEIDGWIAFRESMVPLAWVALPSFAYSWILLVGGADTAWDLLAVLVVLVVLVFVRQKAAQLRLRSNLRSALLASLLPATLGFQLAAMVLVCLIMSLAFHKSTARTAMLETVQLAHSPSATWKERKLAGPLLGPQAVWLVLDGKGSSGELDSFDECWFQGVHRIQSEEMGAATRVRPGTLFPELVTWSRLPDKSAVLVVISPLRTHLVEAQTAGFSIMVLFLVAGGLAVWTIVRKARSLAGPLERLTSTAMEVESGDLSVRTGIHGQDEMGRLGNAMDSMLERLGTLLHEQRDLAKQAKDASLAKSRFLANMSHEIRTPLNGVLGLADLLSNSDLEMREKELVVDLKVSAENLRGLVGDILDLSKIEAERISIEFAPFSPSELLDGVVALYRPTAQAKAVGLNCAWVTNAPRAMMGDSGKLRQILSNLVSNALKFTVGGSVDLRASISMEGSPFLRIEVEDSGTGVAPEACDRIWQAFAQADESTTRRFGGTGLGLSISRSLARLMGGNLVLARSEVGKGSVFVVEIPFYESEHDAVVAEVEKEGEALVRLPEGFHVVVAEDNHVNQKVIIGFLRKLGCEALLVENGEDAVDAVLRELPDLVLMDVHMPQMDGIEATKALRSRGFDGRIWALTASAIDAEKERCLEAGMDGFISKPIGFSELRSVLNRVSRDRG